MIKPLISKFIKYSPISTSLLTAAIINVSFIQQVHAETKLLSEPAISKNNIAFIYAGDLWISKKDGSSPKQLTASVATEKAPHFSPDGQWIAYSSNHDNNDDVYVRSINGGQAKRLTWHPDADIVNGWHPDGQKILFTSRREMEQGRSAQAWQVAVSGGLPEKVMRAVVQAAAWSSDGDTLAYQPYNTAHRGASGWRNHRGGSTPPIWIMSPNDDSYIEVPHVNASDTNPMWLNDDVYFLSDRNRVRNIYQYNQKQNTVAMVTNETVWDIISADSYQNEIIYDAGGVLNIINGQTGKSTTLSISLTPDLPELRPQWKNAMPSLESVKLSSTGKRVLISARGEVFTVPIKDGSTRNITNTDGIRERDAIWSPQGNAIAYTSDKGGEQKLIVVDQTGNKTYKSYTLGEPADYQLIRFTHNTNYIIYNDNHLNLWSINTKSGKRSKISTDNRRASFNISLSPDDRWLAYTKAKANYFNDIYLYDFKKKRSYLITDGMSHADYPAFSYDGQSLYFSASTNAGLTAVGLDMSTQERPTRNALYALVLSKEGKSPLLPKSDEEATINTNDEEQEEDEAKETVIDLDNLSNRIVALPIAKRSYSQLKVASDNSLYFIESDQPGASIDTEGQSEQSSQLMRFDFTELKTSKLADDVNEFELSVDGEVLLTLSNEGDIKTAKIGETLELEDLNTSEVSVKINPKAEWLQIFEEVWRTEQQYFYDANMHGLNWSAIKAQFKTLLPHVARREDLNSLMVEMIAQMEVGHNRVYGGDMPTMSSVKIGLLGADLRMDGSRYKIAKIYTGERWNPSIIAPLAAPGIGVKEGDTIHAVNGQKLSKNINIYSLLENTAGKQVQLLVSRNGNIKKAKTVSITPIDNEYRLRFWHWIENNRKAVDKATDGKVGYVYLPDTADGGFTFFNRMFYAQTDKKAMIIDERRNSGGQAANYIIDVLSRQYLSSWKDRDGMVFDTPGAAVYGPKVMLIDQDAGSGGDFLPYAFKRLNLGKLIGKRTWGGLIGIAANRGTIDGGQALVPFFRFFTPDNEWRVENEGVSPDIDVNLDPTLVNKGKDSQLNRAIKEVMKDLKTYQTIKLDKAPAFPTKLGQ